MSDGTFPAVLLAAGAGTRLAPLTDSIPKCLVPVHGRPLLAYWLDLLGGAGAEPIIVNTHHHASAVRDFIAANPWRSRVELVHEEELLGTGGTLLALRSRLEGESFFAAHADNLTRFSVGDFRAAHESRPPGCVMTMMLFRTPTPESCGVVERDDVGRVVKFHEKVKNPPGDMANGAVYIMESGVFSILSDLKKKCPDISLDLIPACMGRIYTWLNDDYHRDIGTPESYAAAQREYKA